VAQDPEAIRPVVSLEPQIKSCTRRDADLFSVLVSSAIDVVDGQELDSAFATTVTFPPVAIYRFDPKPSSFEDANTSQPFEVSLIVGPMLGPMLLNQFRAGFSPVSVIFRPALVAIPVCVETASRPLDLLSRVLADVARLESSYRFRHRESPALLETILRKTDNSFKSSPEWGTKASGATWTFTVTFTLS
jgi:hypothetical protein